MIFLKHKSLRSYQMNNDRRKLYLLNDIPNGWVNIIKKAREKGDLPFRYSCNNLGCRLEEYNFLRRFHYLEKENQCYYKEYLRPSSLVRHYDYPEVDEQYSAIFFAGQYVLIPESDSSHQEVFFPDSTIDDIRGKLFCYNNKSYFIPVNSKEIYKARVLEESSKLLSKEQTDKFCEAHCIYRYDFPEQHSVKVHTVEILDIHKKDFTYLPNS